MSIRWKLLVISLGPTLLASILLMSFSLWSFQGYFQDTTRADLGARARLLEEGVTEALTTENQARAADLATRLAAGPGIRARVFRPDGSLLASSDPGFDRGFNDWLSAPGVREALAGRATDGIGQGIFASGERFYVALPVLKEGRLLGAVRISLSMQQFHAQVRRNLQGQLLALAGVLLGCTFVGVALAQRIAGPIHKMARFAARIGGGQLGETLEISARDELGLLATELNRMSVQLAAVDETRRVLLANVTHEFLTPVTNVQVTLEALQAGAAADPNLRMRFLQNAYDEMERLKHLLEDLLDLGRLEAGIAPLRTQECALQDLLNRAVRAVESRLRAKSISATVTGADVTVPADPERLLQAFLAILDNAVKYSLTSSAITIHLDTTPDGVRVRFCDEGPGITATDLPRVFDAFFVGDESRAGTGTGLGLAIARRIIEAHGGSIAASAARSIGSEFLVTLPRPTRAPAEARPPEESPSELSR